MIEPTERQIAYANAIADELGIERCTGDLFAYQSFIKTHKPEFDEIKFSKERKKEDDLKFIIEYPYNRKYPSDDFIRFIHDKYYDSSGVYALLDANKDVVYIGKSVRLASRVFQSFIERDKKDVEYIAFLPLQSKADMHILEIVLISIYKPKYNKDCNAEDEPIIFTTDITVEKDFSIFEIEFRKGQK